MLELLVCLICAAIVASAVLAVTLKGVLAAAVSGGLATLFAAVRAERAGGAVVNNRAAVPVAPGSTVAIVLKGDDLALFGGMDTGKRYLLVEGTYTSDLGTGLPLKEEAQFTIRNLSGVS